LVAKDGPRPDDSFEHFSGSIRHCLVIGGSSWPSRSIASIYFIVSHSSSVSQIHWYVQVCFHANDNGSSGRVRKCQNFFLSAFSYEIASAIAEGNSLTIQCQSFTTGAIGNNPS
jgi:hypothetical protein